MESKEHLVGIAISLGISLVLITSFVGSVLDTQAKEKTKQEYIKAGYHPCQDERGDERWSLTPCNDKP
jgi:hypothetical protein